MSKENDINSGSGTIKPESPRVKEIQQGAKVARILTPPADQPANLLKRQYAKEYKSIQQSGSPDENNENSLIGDAPSSEIGLH